MGLGLAGIWEGENLDFERESLRKSYGVVIYIENDQIQKFVKIHVFKNLNDFVFFCVDYQDQELYERKYKQYEDKLIENFRFENPGNNAEQVEVVQLDSRSKILLPFDWQYRDITKKMRKDYNPKNTLTNAYFFENKLRPKDSLPVIALAHYRDNIEDAHYLLDIYKEAIVKDYTEGRQGTVFDDAEIATYRDNNDKIITQSLVIKLRDLSAQYLPIEVRATLQRSSITQGCYMAYSTNATVTDYRMKEVKDLNVLGAWMTIDVMGSSMANLLAHSLGRGLGDYPQMFD